MWNPPPILLHIQRVPAILTTASTSPPFLPPWCGCCIPGLRWDWLGNKKVNSAVARIFCALCICHRLASRINLNRNRVASKLTLITVWTGALLRSGKLMILCWAWKRLLEKVIQGLAAPLSKNSKRDWLGKGSLARAAEGEHRQWSRAMLEGLSTLWPWWAHWWTKHAKDKRATDLNRFK